MNAFHNMYTGAQLEEISQFIETAFGTSSGYIVHEIESEHVHTDTFILSPPGGGKTYVTCGMSTRPMETPRGPAHCELVLKAATPFQDTGKESAVIVSQITDLTKLPFRDNTWYGVGHTVNTHKKFAEQFGYSYFLFAPTGISFHFTQSKDPITFLQLIPIYEEEREWCVEHNSLAFLDKLLETYGEDACFIDRKREVFLPKISQEEMDDYNLMAMLGISKSTLERLVQFLEEQDRQGQTVTYDDIAQWIETHQ